MNSLKTCLCICIGLLLSISTISVAEEGSENFIVWEEEGDSDSATCSENNERKWKDYQKKCSAKENDQQGVRIISKGKRAYQSAIRDNMAADFALDGDRHTMQWTLAGNSFLVVALLGTYRVNKVKVVITEIWLKEVTMPINVDARLFNSDWVACDPIKGVAEYGQEFTVSCHDVLASHVRLSKAGELLLAEVEVYGEENDMKYELLSRGKPATQSSTLGHANASLAVDGETRHMFSHTDYENQPWWQVNLQGEYRVHTVRIFNVLLTCADCGARLTTVQVFTQPPNANTWILCGKLNEPVAVLGGIYEVNCKGVRATQVRLQLNGKDFLELVEVEVYGKQ